MAQYDLDAARIARQRAIAQALQASGNQGFDPAASAGRMVYARSPLEDLNRLAQTGVGMYMGRKADQGEKTLDQQRTADLEKQKSGLLDAIAGKSAYQVPGEVVDGVPMAPINAPAIPDVGGQPMNLAGEETNQKRGMLASILQGADPQASVNMLREQAITQMQPKPPMILADGSAAFDPTTGRLLAENAKPEKETPEDRMLINVVDPTAKSGYRTIKRADWKGEQEWQKPAADPSAGMVEPELTASDEAVAQAIYNYEKSPLSTVGRNPRNIAIMGRVIEIGNQKGTPYFEAEYPARAAALANFGPGKKNGETLKSFSVLLDHLDTIQDVASKMQNGDIRGINALSNWFKKETGSPAPTTLENLKSIVGAEIVKAITGGPGAEADRQHALDAVNKAASPAQLADVLNGVRELAGGQLRGLKQLWATTGLSEDRFMGRLSPGGRKWLAESEARATEHNNPTPGGKPPAAAVPGASETKVIGGKTYHKINGQWVEDGV